MSKKAVIYVRVSTGKQAEDGISLEVQEQKLRAYCEMRGLEVIEVVVDPAQSAGKPLVKRQRGKRVLTLIKKGRVDAVVALKLDRLFRNVNDCLATVEAWSKFDVALHLADMGGSAIDTSSAVGRMFLVMLSGFAEFERNLTSERTRMALAHKLACGDQRLGGEPPYGYAYRGRDLVTNDAEQAVLALARELRSTQSLADVATTLNLRGFRNRSGEPFSRQGVFKMLKGPKRVLPTPVAA